MAGSAGMSNTWPQRRAPSDSGAQVKADSAPANMAGQEEGDANLSRPRGPLEALTRRLTKARQVALAKASWRPKARARATPIVEISKESHESHAAYSPPASNGAPRHSARPPLLPGSACSPQRRQSQTPCTCPNADGSPSPCECRHHGCGLFSLAGRPSSGTSGGSRSSGASTGSNSAPGETGYGTPSGYCRQHGYAGPPRFFMEESLESTPSYASDARPSSCGSSTPDRFCPSPPQLPLSVRGRGSSIGSLGSRPQQVYCLYASPLDQLPINVRSEVETLQEAFEESGSRVKLNVGVATAGSLTKLLTLARSRKGLVLHLSAHATFSEKGELGLVLEDAKGLSHVLWRQNLEEILGIRERGLRNVSLLFLSSCWSQELAQVFVECGCRHVVCLRTRVLDEAARRFSQQFYLSLGVGETLLSSWESARTTLRNIAEKNVGEQAANFILFGQRGADEVNLRDLCGDEEASSESSLAVRELEDAALFLEMKLPPRPENFLGRTPVIHEVLHTFGGVHARRACAVWGPEGIGKSALGLEFAHFAAAPGRPFSCAVRLVRIESADLIGVASALEDELESLAAQLEVALRPGSGDSRSSFGSRQSAPHSARSEFSNPSPNSGLQAQSDSEDFALLLPVRQRLRRGFQQIERSRRGARTLLLIDDEVGAVAGSAEVQKLLGELLENTYQLHVLICSRAPIYRSLGPTKVVNVPLKGLSEPDAAKLFLQRIHRRLDDANDFPAQGRSRAEAADGAEDASPPSRGVMEATISQLRGHPLLKCLGGHPGKIRFASSLVTPGGPGLMELAKQLEEVTS
eukprot:TRINITY_DN65109_c0_g1_i1.p1 TRINITY_DN65109_c0_g1~~TRINITY_DN65109_c0_g1_i1.p1  ORF type:complete len:808 (+),score=138.07 TRINITY_DN65109_c0_g1_i1:100-2523(+)